MSDVRKLLADALVQAAMEDDRSPKVTVSMRVLEIMVGLDLRSLTMKDLEAIGEAASLRADREARAAGVRPADNGAGTRLATARKAMGLSGAELAAAVGISPSAVRAHESGQNGIKSDPAKAYAAALGCSAAWLMFGDGTGPDAKGPVSAPMSGQPKTLTG